MLFIALSNGVHAQSFLKKIGKAVEKEIVNELKNGKSEKKDTPAPSQQPASGKSTTQKSAPEQNRSSNSTSSASSQILASEICINPQITYENPTGAEALIDGINYRILLKDKCAFVESVSQPLRGKTTHVKVWGGIKYKGEVIPVKYIKSHAFEGESLTSVELPHNLEEICEEAFSSSKLKSVVIYGSTWRIGASAFAGTPIERVKLSNGIKKIEGNAFAGCSNLKDIMIPESVTSIGDYVFWDCKQLATIVLPRTLKKISNYMFCGCESLTSYSIPGGIETIGQNAFESSGLTSVIIPLNVKIIEDGAYLGCKNLTKVTIPSTVENFGDDIFLFCEKLSSVYIHKKHKDFTLINRIFAGNNNLLTSYNLDECKGFVWTE